MMKTLHFLAPLPAIAKRTRLAKMSRHFTSQGVRVEFYGWQREAGEFERLKAADPLVRERVILRGGGYASKLARIMYPIWMLVVGLRVLRIGFRQDIFCLGWETAFPALCASVLTRSRVVFDDADRFSLIVKLPQPLHSLVQRLERWASYRSLIHVVPGFSRYDWRHEHMFPLRNTPLSEEFAAAQRDAPERPAGDLVVYVNGWVGETRGAPIFLKLVRMLEGGVAPRIRLLVAGRVDCPAGKALIAHPSVVYYGEISQLEALKKYAVSDVVLTYYDPRIEINHKAEPNKWGDCVFLGVPFIVNSEVETAQPFIEADAALSVNYEDVEGLYRLLQELARNKARLSELADKLKAFRHDYPVFDQQLDRILARLNKE